MRKTPVYTLDGSVAEWLADHGAIMYTEVLESVESAIAGEHSFTGIPVIILQEKSGSTLFTLRTINSIMESMEKAEAWFVSMEEYEKAARVRDARSEVLSQNQA
jgi:hypothetical protein